MKLKREQSWATAARRLPLLFSTLSFNSAPPSWLALRSLARQVEALVLMGGPALPVVTVDFNPPHSQTPRIASMSVADLHASPPAPVDLAISYSSLEHDGLGR